MTAVMPTQPVPLSEIAPTNVTAVMVTYGTRWNLLQESIAAAQVAGAGRVIVINNGATADISGWSGSRFGDFVTVITRPRNAGSAAGYGHGLTAAIEAGGEYLLLLDDDNVIAQDALHTLCARYREYVASVGIANLVVVGFRAAQQIGIAAGRQGIGTSPRPGSFLGFSVLDMPGKVWRHMRWERVPPTVADLRPLIPITACPYGGMLFHKSLVAKFGLPDKRFVLYADDTEYCSRIVRRGGQILLITDACIRDSEVPWNAKSRFPNSFAALLTSAEDLRAYYSTRNNVYLDTHLRPHNRFVLLLNRQTFVILLWVFSKLLRRPERYRLLRRAIADGESARLDVCSDVPLP